MSPRTPTGLLIRLRSFLKAYGTDQKGTTAVEFSIVSIPFLGILFAIFQTSYLFLVQQGLDKATERAARNIKTGQAMAAGYTQAKGSSGAFCESVIAPNLPSYLSCTNLTIDVRPATSWSSSNATTDILTGTTKFCIGSPNSIMIVRVMYPVPPMLSIMTLNASLGSVSSSTAGQSQDSNSNWVYPIMGVYAFQSEPYTATTYTPPTGC